MLSWRARCSRRGNETKIDEFFAGLLAMLDPIRENTKGKGLCARERLFTRLPIGHDAGEIGNLGNPAAIVFLLDLDDESH